MLQSLVDEIRAAGLLERQSAPDQQRLLRRLRAIESGIVLDVLVAADLLIDVRGRNARGPEDYLALFEELRDLSGGQFDPSDLAAAWVDRESGQLQVRFALAGRRYQVDLRVYSFPAFDVDDPVQIANRALVEAGVEARFHRLITVDERRGARPGGVVYLTIAQRAAVLARGVLRLPYEAQETDVWTSGRVDALMEDLREIGLLDHLGEDEIGSALREILPERVHDAVTVLRLMPGTVVDLDLESINDLSQIGEAYRGLIDQLAALSRGEIAPQEVGVSVGPVAVEVSFAAFNHRFACQLRNMGEWVDLGFVSVLNRALSTAGAAGRYHAVETGDQTVVIAYLREGQRRAIRDRGLFTLHDFPEG